MFVNTKKPTDNQTSLNTKPVQTTKPKEEFVKRPITNTHGGGKLVPLENPAQKVAPKVDQELERPKFVGKSTNEPRFVDINKNEDVILSCDQNFSFT